MEYKLIETKTSDYSNIYNIKEVKHYKDKNIKYPFKGSSSNLIDKFLIFGYEKKIIVNSYLYNKSSNQIEITDSLKSFNLNERPSLINEINNDYTKSQLDNDLIAELILPEYPKIYYLDIWNIDSKEIVNNILSSKSYSIIFSINCNGKLYNGLGYINFITKKYKENDIVVGYFYAPIAYVIISDYPYFYHYNEICRMIFYKMREETDDIPLEIILYNLIKYLQAPIYKSILLLFEPIYIDKKPNIKDLIYESTKLIGNISSSFFFKQLSGYPLIDFNLLSILNIIPINLIVEVFIITFLEYDIIFYSEQPNNLALIMYIFSIFNYPFNNSNYYKNIYCISINSFLSGNIKFLNQNGPSMIGVLSSYDPEIPVNDIIKDHFVFDIDKKNIFYLYKEKTDEVTDILDLINYIKDCLNEFKNYMIGNKKFEDGIRLFETIQYLFEELTKKYKKVTNPGFFEFYNNESEIDCIKNNNFLQKAFLVSIIEIIQNFVFIGNHKKQEKKGNINHENGEIVINEDNSIINYRNFANKAGNIFKIRFLNTSKYYSFINFCKNQDKSDLSEQYKIPYLFIYELIQYSLDYKQIDLFKLIDRFYKEKISSDNSNKFDMVNKINEIKDNINIFNYDNFRNHWKIKLRAVINREQEDDKKIFTKVKSSNKSYKTFKRKEYFLSSKILNNYMLYLNNNYKELGAMFKLIKSDKYEIKSNLGSTNNSFEINIYDKNKDSDNNIIHDYYLLKEKYINKTQKDLRIFGSYELIEISNIFEENLVFERFFSNYKIIILSILNILASTRHIKSKYLNNTKIIYFLFDFCEKAKFLIRKYIFIFLIIFQEMEKKEIIQNNEELNDCLNILTFYLKKTNIISKEESEKNKKEINEFNDEINPNILPFDDSSNIPNGQDNSDELLNFITQKGQFFQNHKGLFKKKYFEEVLAMIETVFTGDYNWKIFSFRDKELDELIKNRNKKNGNKFIQKTILEIYVSSYKILNNFLQKFNLTKNELDELYNDILSLLYHLKIPLIVEKIFGPLESENQKKEFEKILQIIIAILTELLENIPL